MQHAAIKFSQIHPFVRYVQDIIIRPETYPVFSNVCPYDCRFFYVVDGRGILRIENESWPLEKGQAVMWNSGISYHMRSDESHPLRLLGTNFDYTQRYSDFTIPIPPDPVDTFDQNRAWEFIEFMDFTRLNRPVRLNNMQVVQDTLSRMLMEYKAQKVFCATQLSGMMTDILVTVCRRLALSVSDKNASASKIDNIVDYIREHYNEEIDNESLGALFGYHPNYLSRQIKLYTGKSMHQYLISYRIARAIDLLFSTELPVSEIAARTGFSDICHFSRIFKQKTSFTPGALRTSSNRESE